MLAPPSKRGRGVHVHVHHIDGAFTTEGGAVSIPDVLHNTASLGKDHSVSAVTEACDRAQRSPHLSDLVRHGRSAPIGRHQGKVLFTFVWDSFSPCCSVFKAAS